MSILPYALTVCIIFIIGSHATTPTTTSMPLTSACRGRRSCNTLTSTGSGSLAARRCGLCNSRRSRFDQPHDSDDSLSTGMIVVIILVGVIVLPLVCMGLRAYAWDFCRSMPKPFGATYNQLQETRPDFPGTGLGFTGTRLDYNL